MKTTAAAQAFASDAYARAALLPEGFRDELAPQAEQHANLVTLLMQTFQQYGYDRVRPPLVEYEDSLFAGPGAVKADQTFRLMDSDTQRVMGLRADMTPQISRLAATRLAEMPRPLRLTYAGTVLRVVGSQIRPTREFMQAGIELIGSDALDADLEVMTMAVRAMHAAGIEGLSLDLTVPSLVHLLAEASGLGAPVVAQVRQAIAARDTASLEALGLAATSPLVRLVRISGPAGPAIKALEALALEGAAADLVADLAALVARLEAVLGGVTLTVDPCESHGFEYKTGVGFALFAGHVRAELGRGGRYQVMHPCGTVESATGFSAYLDSLLSAIPRQTAPEKLLLPASATDAEAEKWRAAGWRALQAFDADVDLRQEASRLGCSHYLDGATPTRADV